MMSSLAMGNAFSAVEHLGAAVSDLEKSGKSLRLAKQAQKKCLNLTWD